MLVKLLKHEWKAVWKVPAALLILLQLMAIMAGLNFMFPFWNSEHFSGVEIIMCMLIILFYVSMIGISVGILIYLAIRFYKSMYSNEGYLTLTLPVSTHQLLLSKGIVMSAWILITSLGIFLSIFVFGCIVYWLMRMQGYAAMLNLQGEFLELLGGQAGRLVLLFAAGFIIGAVNTSSMVIASITAGQLFRKHRVAGAVAAYIGFSTLMQLVLTIAIMPVMFKSILQQVNGELISVFSMMVPLYVVMFLGMAVLSVALYFFSVYVVRRKMNLE